MKSLLSIIAITSLTSFTFAADKEKHPRSPENHADAIIKNCDANGNGTIGKREFAKSQAAKSIRVKHGTDEVEKIFSRSDNNKDGELDKKELERMLPDTIKHGPHKPHAKKHKRGKGK